MRRLLEGSAGLPEEIVVFSRSEATQHSDAPCLPAPAGCDRRDRLRREPHQRLHFHIGDVPNYPRSARSCAADVVFHAAALKQVPTAEYHPFEAVRTNVIGAENMIQAIREHELPVETVIGVSTDKACKPVNVMGMTKAIQERIFAQAALDVPKTRSARPLRQRPRLARLGDPRLPPADPGGRPGDDHHTEMTRFLLSLEGGRRHRLRRVARTARR